LTLVSDFENMTCWEMHRKKFRGRKEDKNK